MPRPIPAPAPDDDTVVVLCLDSDRNPIPAAEGTMGRVCASCGTGVWLSPATAAAIAGRKFELRCPDCLPLADNDDEVMAPTAGQIAEILRAIGPEGAAAVKRLADSPEERVKAMEEILRRARSGEGFSSW